MIKITLEDWWAIKNKQQIDHWQECPPLASFSMAGETHKIWQVGDRQYKTVECNGGMGIWLMDEENS